MEERMQSDGAIYTNNYKQNDKQPDWTGKVTLDKNLLKALVEKVKGCLLYTSPSPRDRTRSRMPSSA